ncbi:MAG: APC family permease [Candidatus Eiseniibacteriota bacterium]
MDRTSIGGAPGPPDAGADGQVELRRAMGLRDTALFLVVAVASPRWIASAAAAGPSALVIWLIALATFFIPLAFTVLELSSRFPEEGGIYVWTRRAFGEFAGFMTGWMYWASNLVFFPGLLYFTVSNALLMAGPRGAALSDDPAWLIGLSLLGLAVAFALNLVGLGVGKWLHNAGAIAAWIPVAMLIAVAAVVWSRSGAATAFSPADMVPTTRLRDIVFWSSIAFAFSGLEAASMLGGEIAGPQRTIPRAILAGGLLIVGIYVLGTAAVLVALPPGEVSALQGLVQAIARAGNALGLPVAGAVAAAFLTLANVGSVGAWLAASARLPFVAGLDRYLPPAFARLHPRWGTPVLALLVQALGSAVFIVLGQAGATVKGAYDAMVGMAVITYFLPYLLMFAALIRLQREPAGPEVHRVPGGTPVAIMVALLGLATTTVSIGLALLPPDGTRDPALAALKVAGSSVVLMAVGAALYLRGKAARSAAT